MLMVSLEQFVQVRMVMPMVMLVMLILNIIYQIKLLIT